MTRLILLRSSVGGGKTKLPPTRTVTSLPSISSAGCHSQAAGGLSGLFWTASSKKGAWSGSDWGRASRGDEVIVKPPAFSVSGTKTSSHWPGRNLPQPSAHVESRDGKGADNTLKPFLSQMSNLNVLMRSLTFVTLETVAACTWSSRGSLAVRSWWLRIALAERVVGMLVLRRAAWGRGASRTVGGLRRRWREVMRIASASVGWEKNLSEWELWSLRGGAALLINCELSQSYDASSRG
jgi:hypothetical protein